MATTVGELFVNVGVKGTEKTVSAFTSMQKGMGGLASTAWETKAAVLGAMYGFEQLMSRSNQLGTSLTNFGLISGANTKYIQQMDYAMFKATGTTGQMMGIISNIKKMMAGVDWGLGTSPFFRLLEIHGGLTQADKYDEEKVIASYRKGLASFGNDKKGRGQFMLAGSSVGLTDKFLETEAKGGFKDISKNPYQTEQTLHTLDKVRTGWSLLFDQIERIVTKINVEFGPSIVTKLGGIVTTVGQVITDLLKVEHDIGGLKLLNEALQGLRNTLKEFDEYMNKRKNFWGQNIDKNGKVIGENPGTVGEYIDIFHKKLTDTTSWLLSQYLNFHPADNALKRARGVSETILPGGGLKPPPNGSFLTVNQTLIVKGAIEESRELAKYAKEGLTEVAEYIAVKVLGGR